jgi:polyisoprenoid-binding protein YceI
MAPRRWLPLLLFPASSACLPVQPSAAPPRIDALAPRSVDAPAEEARHLAIHPEGSIVEIDAVDMVMGPHTLRFTRFRGTLVPEEAGGTGKLTLDVDVRALRTHRELSTSIIKDELLEVDQFPHALVTLSLRPGRHPDERVAEGSLRLHGVVRGVRFVGTLRRRGERWRFIGEFEASRRAHDIRRTPDLDWMILDEFLVPSRSRWRLWAAPRAEVAAGCRPHADRVRAFAEVGRLGERLEAEFDPSWEEAPG